MQRKCHGLESKLAVMPWCRLHRLSEAATSLHPQAGSPRRRHERNTTLPATAGLVKFGLDWISSHYHASLLESSIKQSHFGGIGL
jgi:hypothetical protein